MKKRILLVNPPIYDFSAYDFWLKPYGLLQASGFLRGKAEFHLFDYLDRFSDLFDSELPHADLWGRGKFHSEKIQKPAIFRDIKRHYRRFGIPRNYFQNYLKQHGPFEVVLMQTMMTYWYLGLDEVIEDLRHHCPDAKIVLGGVYATLSFEHASRLGADLVIKGNNLDPLWSLLEVEPDYHQLPLWEAYPRLYIGVLKLTNGCPFRCTYCSVWYIYPNFHHCDTNRSLSELKMQYHLGARDIAFYDDALLFQPEQGIIPFLQAVLKERIRVNFHTPNALNARHITSDIAKLMVEAGFKTFYLGFESNAHVWQKKTGGKVYAGEFLRAIKHLLAAGASLDDMTAYLIVGHPTEDIKRIEDTMHFVHSLGLRIMLSDFSPIPGTIDGDLCSKWVDLNEPLWHNKTVFPILRMGEEKMDKIKSLCHNLNQKRLVA